MGFRTVRSWSDPRTRLAHTVSSRQCAGLRPAYTQGKTSWTLSDELSGLKQDDSPRADRPASRYTQKRTPRTSGEEWFELELEVELLDFFRSRSAFSFEFIDSCPSFSSPFSA